MDAKKQVKFRMYGFDGAKRSNYFGKEPVLIYKGLKLKWEA